GIDRESHAAFFEEQTHDATDADEVVAVAHREHRRAEELLKDGGRPVGGGFTDVQQMTGAQTHARRVPRDRDGAPVLRAVADELTERTFDGGVVEYAQRQWAGRKAIEWPLCELCKVVKEGRSQRRLRYCLRAKLRADEY